ncbi:MAG TPA: PEP-CTERM sorting domain-containing protein [Bryobacteraceae bacterium]|jgi:hypothetical protein|nr:PEP-CTERM sorting domain-containing protein [Bryobacteraceae bacterium]
MSVRYLFAAFLGSVLLPPVSQASVIYLTDGDSAIMYRVDLATGSFSSTSTYSLAYPIAVADTVRLGNRDNGPGQEYDLNGNPTGVTWGGGSFIAQMLDGTTDGSTYNYAVTCCDSTAVYRFDRFWGNGEFLFNIGDSTGGRGIAYDPVNSTLWVAQFNSNVVQYSLTGDVVSSTSALSSVNLVGLSYDPTTDSFWGYNRANTFYNFNRDGSTLGTVVVPGFSTSNVFGGEIAMGAPVPEPSSFALALLGIAGTLVYRRRMNPRASR